MCVSERESKCLCLYEIETVYMIERYEIVCVYEREQ